MVTATTEPVRLPPGPRMPKPIQVIRFLAAKHGMYAALARRYGSPIISVNLLGIGHAVVIGDPVLTKELLNTSTDLLERPTSGGGSLGDAGGPGSTFSLAGDKLLARRKMVLPMFHGKRMRSYEHIIEEEVMREIATWPEGREFETLPSMTRITLGAILRAVFGAEGPALDELRDLVPPMVAIASLVLVVPPRMRRDLGAWSPWGRYLRDRRRLDAIVDSLIADARADPAVEERSDVLALLVQARYDNGEPIPDQHIADEMLTLVASGHETTAGSLAWAVERLRRHPQLLARLTEEVDAGGSELRQATISEVQRTRPVLDAFVRRTKTRIRLGDWVIPEDTNLVFSIPMVHDSEESFPDATSFNPDRFVGAPKPSAWIPFGGGVNRCVGAAFATMESDVTLRTLLREFRFAPTDTPGERARWRGVATVPARGARAVVYRRTAEATSNADSASLATTGAHNAPGILAAVTSTFTRYIKPIDPLPWLKIATNKYWYPLITRRWEEEDITFLNWGYEEDPPMGLPLAPEDEPNRYCIQLYHRTAGQADLSGKQVLEVSCGHGGGAAYLVRTLHPASYTGLDYNPDGVAFARKRHNLPELNFVHGNAENLSFPDESFDAVMNVEASHSYPHFDRFLPEVARVLRPGGHFLYADFRGFLEYDAWDAALASMPMRMVSKREINAEVLRGLDGNSTRYLDLVARHVPKFLQSFGRLFAGAPGTLAYRQLQSGKASYRMYHFIKD